MVLLWSYTKTACDWGLLEKVTGPHIFKKVSAFTNPKFHYNISLVLIQIHNFQPYLFQIYFNITFRYTINSLKLSSGWSIWDLRGGKICINLFLVYKILQSSCDYKCFGETFCLHFQGSQPVSSLFKTLALKKEKDFFFRKLGIASGTARFHKKIRNFLQLLKSKNLYSSVTTHLYVLRILSIPFFLIESSY